MTEIEMMLKRGVNKPSSIPWASSIALVHKEDGTTCFCVDYCFLRSAAVKDSFPLPSMPYQVHAGLAH